MNSVRNEFSYLRLGDDRCDLEHRRQEGLILADEEGLLRRAVYVQYPEQDAQDHGEEGQQCRGHLSSAPERSIIFCLSRSFSPRTFTLDFLKSTAPQTRSFADPSSKINIMLFSQ